MDFTAITNNTSSSEEDFFVYDDTKYKLEKAFREKMNIVSMVIYSLVFVLGVMGNGLVIFITGFRMKKTVNTVWFLNLAIADFTFTFFLPLRIVTLALDRHWPFGLVMCKLDSIITPLNLYASVYLLVVISMDRCVSVRCPVWARNHRTPRLASFVVLGVWILALLLSSPHPYFKETIEDRQDVILCYQNFHNDMEKQKIIHRTLVIFQFITAFITPFSVITFCYGAVVLRLRTSRLSQSNKPFKVITAVIVAFFVFCFPFYVFLFLETKANEDYDLQLVLRTAVPLTKSFLYCNSCVNPFLYFFMGHDSKESLKRSLLSAFENALAEESSLQTTHTKASFSTELESQDL